MVNSKKITIWLIFSEPATILNMTFVLNPCKYKNILYFGYLLYYCWYLLICTRCHEVGVPGCTLLPSIWRLVLVKLLGAANSQLYKDNRGENCKTKTQSMDSRNILSKVSKKVATFATWRGGAEVPIDLISLMTSVGHSIKKDNWEIIFTRNILFC